MNLKRHAVRMRTVFAAAVSAFTLSAAAAGDLTVGSGETKSISGTQTYGTVLVNGTLNVAADSVITVSALKCGWGGNGTAYFNLGTNAKLVVTGEDTDGFSCCFAYDTPTEATLASGSSIETYRVSLSHTGVATSLVTLDNARIVCKSLFYLCRGSTDDSKFDRTRWTAQVRLTGANASITAQNFTRNQLASARLLFNGGCVKTAKDYTSSFFTSNQNGSNTSLKLEGENGNPVVIEANHSLTAYFSCQNANTRCGVQGDCDLVFRGSAVVPLGGANNQDSLVFAHTGKTVVLNGTLKMHKADALPATARLEIGPAGTLDLAGYGQKVASVEADGPIADSVGGATLTLAGTGVSVLSETIRGLNLRVDAGTANLRCRRRTGFRHYRFTPTARYGANATGTQYTDLFLYDLQGDNVSPNAVSCTCGSPQEAKAADALDGNVETKFFMPGSLNKSWVSASFATAQPVSSYSFMTPDDYGPLHKYAGTGKAEPATYDTTTCRDVSGFRFEGSDDGALWRTIDEVPSFMPEDLRYYTYPARSWPRTATLGSVYVEKGATLVFDDVDVSVGSFVRRGSVTFLNESTVTVGGAADTTVTQLDLSDAAGLTKTGAGTTTVFAESAYEGPVDVQSGTLRFAGCGGTGPYFRFVITANRDDANANNIQFSELALYDAAGERINGGLTIFDGSNLNKDATLLQAGEVTAIYKAGSDSERPPKLTDGDTGTKCGLYVNTKPNPITFRVKDAFAAKRAVSYALATANDHSERDPAGWYLESSTNGTDWIRLDARNLETVGADRKSWASYNEGKPYYATNLIPCGAAFDSSAVVSVASGATLDLSLSATEIGALRVDLASAGTIRGFVPAAEGVLDLVGVLPGMSSPIILPLAVEDGHEMQRLENWTVRVDGKVKTDWRLFYEGGELKVLKAGMILLVR